MSATRSLALAPAKINLTLTVRGRRADGYHELDTVLVALTLADRLELEVGGPAGLELEVRGPAGAGVPADPSNLVLRAARALLGAPERHPGLRFVLEKQVPAGGGLGGGSADAAAAVLLLCAYLGLDPDAPAVQAELAGLGSDCLFFLAARRSGLARCTGRGEQVEPWAASLPWPVLVVAPSFACATAQVYRAHQGGRSEPDGLTPEGLAGLSRAALEARLRNDLLAAALRSHPPLGEFQAWLEGQAPGRFHLSGSGSSWFALCDEEAEAEALERRLVEAAKARRYALRGPWITRAAGRGVCRID